MDENYWVSASIIGTMIGGWAVIAKSATPDKGLAVFLRNESLDLQIDVPNKYLYMFGYKVFGPEAGIGQIQTKGTDIEQCETILQIVSETLQRSQTEPTIFHGIRYFRREYEPRSKAEIATVRKMVKLLQDQSDKISEYQKGKR